MLQNYTARYQKVSSGYTGELLEWPEVTAQAGTLEECREKLHDALNQRVKLYNEQSRDIPDGGALIEWISVEVQFDNEGRE